MKPRSNFINRYSRRFLLVCSCFCHLLFLHPVNIAAQKISSRPTVGLVLSGGGAHGIAHLGVIKVMEEAGLRPDYITGVSMGSIIGGMYSLGYSADSLHKILNEINWDLVISNNIPENKVAFVEKDHFDNSIISLPLSFKKVILPSGLINGQQIENTLSFYGWPAADISDFSKLPIPFMCVATDIITYTKVDLKTGYLPDAIRASSAVPSIFTPLKIDTLLLLDGGLIRNFAASEALDMGADILIGSYVGFKGYKEDDLQSVSGILKQIAMFRSLNDFDEEKKLCNVIIRPETSEFPIFAFEKVDSFIQRGYEAALPYKEYFRKLADSLDLIGTQEPLVNILDKGSYKFDKIEFKGNKRYSDSQILGVMDIRPGEKIDKYLIRDRIELLFGKAWFDKVKYRIVPRNDSLILAIDCIEKPLAMLYGSVHYDNSLLSGLVLGISVKNLITQRSVINLDSYIGQYYRFKLNLLQYVDRNEVFGISANFYADNTRLPMLELRGDRGDVISRNVIPGIGFSQRIGLNQMVGISANYENMNLILRYVSNAHLKSLSYNYLSASYYYQINTLDRKQFPDKGIIFNFKAGTSKLLSETVRTDSSKVVLRETSGEYSFNRFFTFCGNYKQYFTSPDSKLTFSVGADALFITDSDSVSAQNNFYLLGGIESLNNRSVPMIGFHSNEIQVNKMAGLRSEVDAELFDNFHISIMANIFAAQRFGSDKVISLLTGYGAGIGYNSIIGPLKIGVMYGNSDHEKYFRRIKGYISIGYNF